jgi:hypothetical protein
MAVALAQPGPVGGAATSSPIGKPRKARRWGPAATHALVLVAYSMLTVVMTWPATVHLRTQALSNGGDGSSGLWGQWYLPHALLGGQNPVGATRSMFWPVGANLVFHSTAALPTLLATPLVHTVGLVAAFNLVELSALPLSGYAMWLLARRVCGDPVSAFVAGAAFAFVPYHFVHTGSHVNLLHVELLPLAWLAALSALDGRRWPSAIPLGVVVAATLLTDFTLTALVLVGVAVIFVTRWRDVRTVTARLGLAAGVAVIGGLPIILPSMAAVSHHEASSVAGLGGANLFSTDLLSWLVPSAAHPVWGHAFASLDQRFLAGGEGMAFPGWTVLTLGVLAVLWARMGRSAGVSEARPVTWATVALVGVVLSLGPFLMVDGRTLPWVTYRGATGGPPLPYLVLAAAPALDNLRVPGRFAILGIAGLDVLAAMSLAMLRARCRGLRSRNFVAAAALALIVVEFLPGHLETTSTRIPAAYAVIAADHSGKAVLELPLQWRTGFQTYGDDHPYRDDTRFLYYATAHHHPVVSGMVARLADRRMESLLAPPVYQQILGAEGDTRIDGRPSPPPAFTGSNLAALGIGFVVCHRDVPAPEVCGYVQNLRLPILVDDGTVIVWRTT